MVVGIAAGNCAAFVPLAMLVVLPIVGFYLQVRAIIDICHLPCHCVVN